MSTAPLARILVVDDAAAQMRAVCDALRDHGYETEGFTSGSEALAALGESVFDILLTDLVMPGMDGVMLLSAALKIDSQLVGILMTGKGTIETAVEAMKAGALDYVLKPIRLRTILPVLARALEVRRLRQENLQLKDTVAIHELNEAIAYTVDPDVLLGKIADAALAQLDADEVSIMLPADDDQTLRIAAVRGASREHLLGTRVPMGAGIAGWVAAQHEPLLLEGEVKEERFTVLYPRGEIRSALCLPMIARGNLVGLLNVNCTRRPQAFTPGRIKVLSIFTSAAATGIEASRLYAEQRRTDARYREVLQMAADAIISLDSEFRIILFNSAAERIFGWTTAEVLGKPLDVLIPDHLAETYRREFEAFDRAPAATIPRQGRGPFSARRKDGTEFRVEVSVSRLESDDKCIYTAVLRDITQRLAQEERIMRLSRIQAVLSGINSAIVRIRDRDALFREACRIAVEEGMFRMAWIGVAEPDLSRVRPVASMGIVDGYLEVIGRALEAAGLDEGAGGRALRGQQPVVFNDVENDPGVAFRKEALARGYRSLAVLPLVVNRAPAGLLALYAAEPHSFDSEEMKLLRELSGDISFALEVMEKEAQLNYVAHYDVLTGLPNRALFEERLDQRIRAARRGGRIFAVVLLDLERFRNVNQTLGRNVGDSVLRQFGQRLSEAIGETGSLAHVGADDFAIATRECNDETDVARTIEHILAASLGSPFDGGGTELRLAARAGIALHPADGVDAESLWHNAEAALRESARSGEKYQFYAPHLNASVAQTLRLENRLRGALERSEFVLHYQPKIDLETGRIAGLEALIRWQDPETGLVPPGQFIPLLEETGLIVPVGNWAMREAVGAAATLRARGFGSVRIAVNVSALQLQRKDFVQDVETVIAGARAQPQLLDLEITESAIMHDIAENVRKLGDVRSLGVELAIDDFGTGYSSLSYIARLPVDVLKIDRAFIKNLEEDTDSMSIVQTIVSLAHMLECRVVAEGVETEGQAAILRQLQCEQCQGFLFSKPVALPEIERMLGRSAAT